MIKTQMLSGICRDRSPYMVRGVSRIGNPTYIWRHTTPIPNEPTQIAIFLEVNLGRLINPDSAGKERTRLTKTIALAVRELAKQTAPGAESRDLAAYIALSLDGIAGTIDVSVTAWEKRGYWVKADRFRMEWLWAGQLAGKLRTALVADDWGGVAALAAQTAQRLSKVNVSENHRLGKPWQGAWQELERQ